MVGNRTGKVMLIMIIKRYIYVERLLLIGDVLNMYFQCKTCGYKYNFVTSYIKAKCLICGSTPISFTEKDTETDLFR